MRMFKGFSKRHPEIEIDSSYFPNDQNESETMTMTKKGKVITISGLLPRHRWLTQT